jgi:hypothetical protein
LAVLLFAIIPAVACIPAVAGGHAIVVILVVAGVTVLAVLFVAYILPVADIPAVLDGNAIVVLSSLLFFVA